MGSKVVQAETRVLGVRLPIEEARRVEMLAGRVGLNKNDFIRMMLLEKPVFADAQKLDEAIASLRGSERLLGGYLDRLDSLVAVGKGMGWTAEVAVLLEGEIKRSEPLLKELFRAQRRAVRVLDAVRAKVR